MFKCGTKLAYGYLITHQFLCKFLPNFGDKLRNMSTEIWVLTIRTDNCFSKITCKKNYCLFFFSFLRNIQKNRIEEQTTIFCAIRTYKFVVCPYRQLTLKIGEIWPNSSSHKILGLMSYAYPTVVSSYWEHRTSVLPSHFNFVQL
mgnify:CR=1 FL=1